MAEYYLKDRAFPDVAQDFTEIRQQIHISIDKALDANIPAHLIVDALDGLISDLYLRRNYIVDDNSLSKFGNIIIDVYVRHTKLQTLLKQDQYLRGGSR